MNYWSHWHPKAIGVHASTLKNLEKEDQLKRNVTPTAEPNESDTAFTLALVLGLFGVLAAIGSTGWAATSTLFILAALAGIGGLVFRNATDHPRQPDKSAKSAARKAQFPELRPPGAAGSSEPTPGAGFNVNQFYRYPMNRVAAIFDDLARVTTALPELEQAGFELAGMNVLSGREGARLLDLEGSGQGLWARVLRALQRAGAFEGEALRIHDSALRNDQAIIFVPVRNDSEEQLAARILHQCGGRSMFRFNRWTIDPLPVIQLSEPHEPGYTLR